ncbi:hypothetical protein [Sorangium sp. So ce281]|uniref:hypothetical protein n=1 Tax=Sorangium sp. So ce281 TaxID=3133293 RepID=UPI003F6099CC
MKIDRRFTFAFAFMISCLAGASVVGCSAGAGTMEDDFEVNSDPQAGLLARVDYDGGGYVEFLRNEEGGVFIGSVFEKTGFDPLRGIQISRFLPSELFTHLTNRPAPPDLIASECGGDLLWNPEALATQGQPNSAGDRGPGRAEELGTAASAFSAADFSARFCTSGTDHCILGGSGNRSISSGGRANTAEGHADVLSGSLRLRVLRKRIVGRDETLGNYIGSEGVLLRFSESTPGINRVMRVIVDQAETASYHLAINFSD